MDMPADSIRWLVFVASFWRFIKPLKGRGRWKTKGCSCISLSIGSSKVLLFPVGQPPGREDKMCGLHLHSERLDGRKKCSGCIPPPAIYNAELQPARQPLTEEDGGEQNWTKSSFLPAVYATFWVKSVISKQKIKGEILAPVKSMAKLLLTSVGPGIHKRVLNGLNTSS